MFGVISSQAPSTATLLAFCRRRAFAMEEPIPNVQFCAVCAYDIGNWLSEQDDPGIDLDEVKQHLQKMIHDHRNIDGKKLLTNSLRVFLSTRIGPNYQIPEGFRYNFPEQLTKIHPAHLSRAMYCEIVHAAINHHYQGRQKVSRRFIAEYKALGDNHITDRQKESRLDCLGRINNWVGSPLFWERFTYAFKVEEFPHLSLLRCTFASHGEDKNSELGDDKKFMLDALSHVGYAPFLELLSQITPANVVILADEFIGLTRNCSDTITNLAKSTELYTIQLEALRGRPQCGNATPHSLCRTKLQYAIVEALKYEPFDEEEEEANSEQDRPTKKQKIEPQEQEPLRLPPCRCGKNHDESQERPLACALLSIWYLANSCENKQGAAKLGLEKSYLCFNRPNRPSNFAEVEDALLRLLSEQ